jgi:hypothetical protein
MSKNDIQALLYQLVDELAPTYGIKDRERFVDALASIIGYEDPSWDPAAAGDSGHSIGLFQLHDAGQGTGMSVAQRSDPETNIRKAISYLGPIWASSETQGLGFDQSLQRMISEGQRPADPELAFQRAKAASADITAGASLQPGAGTLQPAGGGSMANSDQDIIAWLKAHGFASYVGKDADGTEYPFDPGTGGPLPSWLGQAYAEDTMGATSGQTPEEAGEIVARTGLYGVQTAQAEQNLGDYDRLISMDEREQKRKEIETEISAGTLEWNKGVDKFNAWLNATSEARLRAEKEMEQKEWQLPTKYFPGTEPGGMLSKVSERYGIPFTPLEGTPVTQENTAEGIYNKWQGNMGVPLQAPTLPSNGGSATPQTETQNFIQELLRKHALRVGELPGMARGGFMPQHRPLIAGERGPEVIQPTNMGTAVTPIVGPGGENPASMAQLYRPGAYQHRPDYGRLLEGHHRRSATQYQRWQASRRF